MLRRSLFWLAAAQSGGRAENNRGVVSRDGKTSRSSGKNTDEGQAKESGRQKSSGLLHSFVESSAAAPLGGVARASDTLRGSSAGGFLEEGGVGVSPPTRSSYAKSGYDFVEQLRLAGPRAAMGATQSSLMAYALVGGACVLYVIYYMTTYSFRLTTDPSPQRNTMFQRYPSDYVVLENKYTGRRRVLVVDPAPEDQRRPDGTLPYRDRLIHVNRLKDRLVVYQQTTRTAVVMDTGAILAADRFIDGKGAGDRTRVAVRRSDQLMADNPTGSDPVSSGGVSKAGATGKQGPGSGPKRVLVETTMRMRDTKNGAAQGNIIAFQETIKHAIEEALVSRFYDALLARTMAGGTRKVYAEEMIRNGAVTAEGIGIRDLVTDVDAFEADIFDTVTRRMGDDVILYEHSIKLF